jgi:putative hydrolase of the HAD superfamily
MTDFIIYSHEVGLAKPDPRIYQLTCERLGAQPAEIIFLDDFEPCVAAACAYGLHGIRFRDTTQTISDIEACLRSQAE